MAKDSGLVVSVSGWIPNPEFDGVIFKSLEYIGDDFDRLGQAQAPRRSGKLAASFNHKFEGTKTVNMKPDVWYFHLVNGGSKPHAIASKRGKVMKFNGGFVGAPISHPGVKANAFASNIFRQRKVLWEEHIRKAIVNEYNTTGMRI